MGRNTTWLKRHGSGKGRLFGAASGVAIAIVMAAGWAVPVAAGASTSASATWFAPYVDTTLPPVYPVATRAEDPAAQTAFGFIVSKTATDCVPSWGTYYSLTSADQAPLRLSALFGRMELEGEVPIVSFGGEANTTLADACQSATSLEAAYQDVLTHYGLFGKRAVFDFDIEGAAQGDTAALARQATAIAKLQTASAAAGGQLGAWLTLPVSTQGLLPVAENVVKSMLTGGVELSGVNVMTMYFWPSPGNGAPMLSAVEDALTATHTQLATIFAAVGIPLTSAQVWEHEGATVQIGDAGVADQAFTVHDAVGLVQFAQSVGLGRVSMWSINQDQPCAGGSTGGYSTYCSNVPQAPLAFDTDFASLTGSALDTPLLPKASGASQGATSGSGSSQGSTPGASQGATSTSGSGSSQGSTPGSSQGMPEPQSAPASYPAWSAAADYPGGYKVLMGTSIFRAKWWSHDQQPVTNPPEPWDTPWELIGSVPPGTAPWLPQPLPAGTYPVWSAHTVYTAGLKVLHQGLPYEARWWTEGTAPSSTWPTTGGSPWQPLWTVPGEPAGS